MSKRKFFYDTLQDSSRRLGNSMVMCKGSPAWINLVSGLNTDQQATVNFLPFNGNDKAELIPLTPEYFEIRRLPQLGYVDYGDYSFYLCRRPVRAGKQGLDNGNVAIPQVPGGRSPNFHTLLSRKEFVQMLSGKYDKFEKVWEKIVGAEEPVKRAVSKTMALSVDDIESVSIWNRGIKVGIANNPRKYGPVFKLPQKYRYLTEELSENGIKVE